MTVGRSTWASAAPPTRDGPRVNEEIRIPQVRLIDQDVPGFWEGLGYHNRGDQWLEERYSGD